jgi:hypothetical protein
MIFKFSNFQIIKCAFTLISILAHWQIGTLLFAQDSPKSFSFDGYLSDMANFNYIKMSDTLNNKTYSNLLHNRLNFKWLPNEKLTFVAEFRNRFANGDNLKQNPDALKEYSSDNGLVDLSYNLISDKSYVLNTSVDRLYASYESGKFKASLGRQRINWGQTLVWNPNDIFNAYSFFDFDYVERPGSDALRLQYYNTEITSTELALKLNKSKKLTAAAFHKLNIFQYDIQFLGGILDGEDFVIGTGWSGAIRSISFRGEVSYFHPKDHFADSSGTIMASISADYIFSNQAMVTAEYLYSGFAPDNNFNVIQYYSAPQNVKGLSFVKHNLVMQISYPITPLLSGSIAGMILPKINGYYFSPSLSYSIAQNLDASFYMQMFNAKIDNSSFMMNMIFLRLKMNF